MRIAEEYRAFFGLLIAVFFWIYLEDKLPYPYVFLLIYTSICLYTVYRRTILFQKFRLKDIRFFIRSNVDLDLQKRFVKSAFFVALIMGLGYGYMLYEQVYLDYQWCVLVLLLIGISTTYATHYYGIPAKEILFNKHSIEVINHGETVKTLHALSGYEISNERLLLSFKGSNLELSELLISDEQLVAIKAELEKKKK